MDGFREGESKKLMRHGSSRGKGLAATACEVIQFPNKGKQQKRLVREIIRQAPSLKQSVKEHLHRNPKLKTVTQSKSMLASLPSEKRKTTPKKSSTYEEELLHMHRIKRKKSLRSTQIFPNPFCGPGTSSNDPVEILESSDEEHDVLSDEKQKTPLIQTTFGKSPSMKCSRVRIGGLELTPKEDKFDVILTKKEIQICNIRSDCIDDDVKITFDEENVTRIVFSPMEQKPFLAIFGNDIPHPVFPFLSHYNSQNDDYPFCKFVFLVAQKKDDMSEFVRRMKKMFAFTRGRLVKHKEGDPELFDLESKRPRTRSLSRSRRSLTKSNSKNDLLLVYPEDGKGSVSIYRSDLDVLEPGEFLNDSIIDFYLRYLFDRLDDFNRGRIHIFNTFFYKKYTLSGHDSKSKYESVKKWTNDVDIFSQDFLIMPINENLHWKLLIFCFPNRVDVDNLDPEQKPHLLLLDSLGSSSGHVFRMFRNYLKEEWEFRKPRGSKNLKLVVNHIFGKVMKVPEQPNHCDCGVYLLHYVELFLQELPHAIDENFLDRRNWFERYHISAKRKHILDTLNDLNKSWEQFRYLKLEHRRLSKEKEGPTSISHSGVEVHTVDHL